MLILGLIQFWKEVSIIKKKQVFSSAPYMLATRIVATMGHSKLF